MKNRHQQKWDHHQWHQWKIPRNSWKFSPAFLRSRCFAWTANPWSFTCLWMPRLATCPPALRIFHHLVPPGKIGPAMAGMSKSMLIHWRVEANRIVQNSRCALGYWDVFMPATQRRGCGSWLWLIGIESPWSSTEKIHWTCPLFNLGTIGFKHVCPQFSTQRCILFPGKCRMQKNACLTYPPQRFRKMLLQESCAVPFFCQKLMLRHTFLKNSDAGPRDSGTWEGWLVGGALFGFATGMWHILQIVAAITSITKETLSSAIRFWSLPALISDKSYRWFGRPRVL